MFWDFWKKAEEKIDEQSAEIKENLKEILDENGNVREGVTSKQVRDATNVIAAVAKTYHNIAERGKEVEEGACRLQAKKAEIRQFFEDEDFDNLLAEMPMTKMILGM